MQSTVYEMVEHPSDRQQSAQTGDVDQLLHSTPAAGDSAQQQWRSQEMPAASR